MCVVEVPLVVIVQNLIGLRHCLEFYFCFLSLGLGDFIRVGGEGSLVVSLLDFDFGGARCYAQDLCVKLEYIQVCDWMRVSYSHHKDLFLHSP